MKRVLLIGDGASGWPLPEYAGRTALQAAKKPYLDRLCSAGRLGLAQILPPGVSVGTDTALLALLGQDIAHLPSRAHLEGAGMGNRIDVADWAWRLNLVSISASGKMLSHSGGDISPQAGRQLVEDLLLDTKLHALLEKFNFRLAVGSGFRHQLVRKGKVEITTIPPHDILGKQVEKYWPVGGAGLRDIMTHAHLLLQRHPLNHQRLKEGKLPANYIWPWGGGPGAPLKPFSLLYAHRGLCAAHVPVVKGIASLLGLTVANVPGSTGDIHTNWQAKVKAALTGLCSGYDFILVHLEAPDECSHRGDWRGKIKALEILDAMARALHLGMEKTGGHYRLLVMSDHATPLATRTHAPDPIPFFLYDNHSELAHGRAYHEIAAAATNYQVGGQELLKLLFSPPGEKGGL